MNVAVLSLKQNPASVNLGQSRSVKIRNTALLQQKKHLMRGAYCFQMVLGDGLPSLRSRTPQAASNQMDRLHDAEHRPQLTL